MNRPYLSESAVTYNENLFNTGKHPRFTLRFGKFSLKLISLKCQPDLEITIS